MLAEKVSRHGMPDDVPRTWILTQRTVLSSVKSSSRASRRSAESHTVIPIDTCHCSDGQRARTAGRDSHRTLPTVRAMTLPALVLVHGGRTCRRLLGSDRRRNPPAGTGSRASSPSICRAAAGKPGDLATVTIDDWVDSFVADIEDAGLDEVVICRPLPGGRHRPRCGDQARAPRGSRRWSWPRPSCRRRAPRWSTRCPDGSVGMRAGRRRHARSRSKCHRVAARLVFCNGMTRRQQRVHPASGSARESSVLVTREGDHDATARRGAAHVDPHTARPRALGDSRSAGPSPRSAVCRPDLRWTPATT